MNLRLGEALIKAGKLRADQLEETLKEQAIFGGKFGTNLIEMGYIDEAELAEFLSSKTGIPHVGPEQLMNIPPELLALIPAEIVAKYRVIPLALNKKRLTLAMADPCDYTAIDELSFITGCIISPVLTTELRLVCALEKHYNISRDRRSLRVSIQGRRRDLISDPPRRDPEAALQVATTLGSPFCDSAHLDFPAAECFGAPETAPQCHNLQLPPREPEKEGCWETVVRELAEARSRQGIAGLIVGHAAQLSERVALLLFKGDRAIGWMARSKGSPVQGFETLAIPLDEAPHFRRLIESKNCYLGPVADSPAHGRLQLALGEPLKEHALLAPLVMTGKVVGVLYLESAATKELGGVAPKLHKLVGKASLAFEILILKNKILMT